MEPKKNHYFFWSAAIRIQHANITGIITASCIMNDENSITGRFLKCKLHYSKIYKIQTQRSHMWLTFSTKQNLNGLKVVSFLVCLNYNNPFMIPSYQFQVIFET